MDGRVTSAFTRVFRRAMPGHDGAACWGKFFDYTPTTLLTTYRVCARRLQPRSLRACSRDDPEYGARRGVLRGRLVTACPGRPGTPPARHYDLAARSSLHGSARQMPAVVGRRAPKETEARPWSLKSPRWSAERRASRVMGNYRSMGLHINPRLSALPPM